MLCLYYMNFKDPIIFIHLNTLRVYYWHSNTIIDEHSKQTRCDTFIRVHSSNGIYVTFGTQPPPHNYYVNQIALRYQTNEKKEKKYIY